MKAVQLTLEQYAAWVACEERNRLTQEDERLIKLGYSRAARKKQKEREILTAENKGRQYRRIRTFERYLNEQERCRAKRVCRRTEVILETNDELTDAMKRRFLQIRDRCSTKSLAFDLTVEYLVELARSSDYCPIFGDRLIYFGEGKNAEVDRSIPALGYTKGNIVFLSSRANRLKSDHTIETCELLLAYLRGLN